MQGGKDWWDQILEALKTVEYMVLVMTQAAMESTVVRKEWRQARQEGVGVIPVFGQPNLDLTQLPSWMRDVQWVNTDVPEQWTRFIRTLESPYEGTRVPFMADDLPVDFVPRVKEFEELAGSLLGPQLEEPIAITAALKGAGGYGKTTLAKALCHDERIQDVFHHGILWVTLGEEPNIMAGLTKLYAGLTDERPNFIDQEDASNKLAEVLKGKDCVMVIDDVWNAAHVTPFLRGGKRCARIITTRDSGTLPPSAKLRVDVDAMHLCEAVALLAFELPKEEEVALESLAKDLGEWPFLLKLVNASLRDCVKARGQDLSDALIYVRKALEKRGLTAFDARNPIDRNQAVAVTLGASFEHLNEDELARYHELAIFPEDIEIPLSAITKLWGATGGLDNFDTEELCTRLSQLSLVLRYDPITQHIQLHDVVRTYLEGRVGSQLSVVHRKFLDVFGLMNDPVKAAGDPYLCRHLAYHLVKAEWWEELKKLLLNIDWLYAKLEILDISALLSDFDWLQNEKNFSLIQGAIRLSGHIVGKDPSQLWGQLLGRLQMDKSLEIQKLVEHCKQWQKSPWLRPLQCSLIAPGGPLIRTLSGHRSGVTAVAVAPYGSRAISGSDNGTCIVWDLATGQALQILRGHHSSVKAVAVTPDGTRAISASVDHACKLWDLASGQTLYTLSGHTSRVTVVAVTPDGRKAISASNDDTCIVWDLAIGQALYSLRGHSDRVTSVVVTPDGRCAISGSADATCIVWNLASGHAQHILREHSNSVRAVGVTPDGTRAISASTDFTCKVWDLASGQILYTLNGHSARVTAVAVTPDNRQVISASDDATCKVWDLASGQILYTLSGHCDRVTSVIVTPDGMRTISAADDDKCIVWDLASGQILYSLNGHSNSVTAVAVTPDGTQAISGSDDGTCKVWDLSCGGGALYPLNGHSNSVTAVAVTPDGTQAISGSDDGTCKVWDLASGQILFTLSGHSLSVTAVVVTPDGSRAISSGEDAICNVWDMETRQVLHAMRGHHNLVTAIAVTPDGRQAISVATDATCIVWDLANGKALYTLRGHSSWVTAVAVSPDGERAISVSADLTCQVWNLVTGRIMHTLSGHSNSVRGVLVTPDSTRAITASADATCIVWDLVSGQALHILSGHSDSVRGVAVTPDGRWAISGSTDHTCKVWDLVTGEALDTFSGHSNSVNTVLVNPQGSCVISVADDHMCKVWDLASAKEMATFTGESPISCCVVAPDGRTIVVGEQSGRVHVLCLEGVD